MATPSALVGRWNIVSDEVSGSGTARLVGSDKITGKIRFHRGDESGFVARRVGS